MKRFVIIILTLLVLSCGVYLSYHYWIHRYDSLIARAATQHHIDPVLVWSLIYEENHFFFPWKRGRNGEIGLMQVTPAVAHEWAADAGVANSAQPISADAITLLRDPEHNIQIGCWYLEKFHEEYRDTPGREARMLAAYNAGDSRVTEWNRVGPGQSPLSEDEFISRIDIQSTRAYVTSILSRYRSLKAR